MKTSMIDLNFDLTDAVERIHSAEETLYSAFIGESLEKPYSDWMDSLNIAKNLLQSVLNNKKFKVFLKEEEDYFDEMEGRLDERSY